MLPIDRTQSLQLTFLLRPFDGWTGMLRDDCLKSPSGGFRPKIFIEGPYGRSNHLHLYENILFIVGGTGVSGAIPYPRDHVYRTKSQLKTSKGSDFRTSKITLIWATKHSAMIHDIASRESQPVIGRDDIKVKFFATSQERLLGSETADDQVRLETRLWHFVWQTRYKQYNSQHCRWCPRCRFYWRKGCSSYVRPCYHGRCSQSDYTQRFERKERFYRILWRDFRVIVYVFLVGPTANRL